MSLSLTLIFARQQRFPGSTILGYNRLKLDLENSTLFDEVKKIGTPITIPVDVYEDEGISSRIADDDGNLLTICNPQHLVSILSQANLSPWDTAVMTFLFHLPPDTFVVLLWS